MNLSTDDGRRTFPARAEAPDDAVAGKKWCSSVLIVDDESHIRGLLQQGLAAHFGRVEATHDAGAGDALLERLYFDLIISGIRLSGRSGVDWLQGLRKQKMSAERRHIQRVLKMNGGNNSAAARLLGVSRKILGRKCRIWSAEP